MGSDMIYTLASTIAKEFHQVKRSDSVWSKMFPVFSESTTVVVQDTFLDERFTGSPFVHGPPYVRFMCISPLFYQDIVIGGVYLVGKQPQQFPLSKTETLASFCRIVTEIITCESVHQRNSDVRYHRALHSWPRSLSGVCNSLLSAFHRVDGTIFKLLALIPASEEEQDMADGTMEEFSLALGELNVRLDVVNSIGDMMQELVAYSEVTSNGPNIPGLKSTTFSDLIGNINTAVSSFGCEDNFDLSVDQTAKSINKISTFSSTIIAVFRCLFSFFDQSRVMLNVLCVVLVDQLDFQGAINSDVSTMSGQLCFEFVANGDYVYSTSFASLWSQEPSDRLIDCHEMDCPTCLSDQFDWLREVVVRMGGGMSVPTNNEEDKEKYKSCVSVSIWFPCMFEKEDLLRSKEILLNSAQSMPFKESPLSPVLEDSNCLIAPSDLMSIPEGVHETHHAVLVIDDSILVQKMFKKIFDNLGIDCEVASNGKSGLELMKSKHFDIVFVDFIMPEQGGVSTIQMFNEWRMNKLYSGMYVTDVDASDDADINSVDDPLLIVGISGTYDGPSVHEGFRNGVRVFLMKPVSMSKCKAIYDAKISGQLNTEYAGKKLSDIPDDDKVTS